MKGKWKSLFVSIALPLAVGGSSALLTKDSFARYRQLPLPPLAPPPLAFPIVWTILFLLMGISCWLVWEASVSHQESGPSFLSRAAGAPGLKVYALQLAVNLLWPLFFFRAGWLGFSFFWLLLLLGLVTLMILRFSSVSKAAALLQVPYVLWLLFAGYLNLSVWLMAK